MSAYKRPPVSEALKLGKKGLLNMKNMVP